MPYAKSQELSTKKLPSNLTKCFEVFVAHWLSFDRPLTRAVTGMLEIALWVRLGYQLGTIAAYRAF